MELLPTHRQLFVRRSYFGDICWTSIVDNLEKTGDKTEAKNQAVRYIDHNVIIVGGKFYEIDEIDNICGYYKIQEITKDKYNHRYLTIDKEKVYAFDLWERGMYTSIYDVIIYPTPLTKWNYNKLRRKYDKEIFDSRKNDSYIEQPDSEAIENAQYPQIEKPKDITYLNLYTKPKYYNKTKFEGDAPPFIEFIKKKWCGGDEKLHKYILETITSWILNPSEIKIPLIFDNYCESIDIIKKLIGENYCFDTRSGKLISNKQLEKKLFLVVDKKIGEKATISESRWSKYNTILVADDIEIYSNKNKYKVIVMKNKDTCQELSDCDLYTLYSYFNSLN